MAFFEQRAAIRAGFDVVSVLTNGEMLLNNGRDFSQMMVIPKEEG
jgi:hypothetical protein